MPFTLSFKIFAISLLGKGKDYYPYFTDKKRKPY